MYHFLIVDDDALITEELQNMLDWNSIGLERPLVAHSVSEAQRIFTETSIHILLSDIEMMGKDGFDLLSWVQENYPETLRGFLTCHARFDFAQKAFRVGVRGYLLKPVNKEELRLFLSGCLEQLQKKPQFIEKQDFENYGKTVYSPLIQTAIAYIEQHLEEALSRDSISRELFVSETYLSKMFSKELNMTLSDYITEQRILRAKKLLSETGLPVTEISLHVGYNYPAYFSKIFREKVGMTPNQYRRFLIDSGEKVY